MGVERFRGGVLAGGAPILVNNLVNNLVNKLVNKLVKYLVNLLTILLTNVARRFARVEQPRPGCVQRHTSTSGTRVGGAGGGRPYKNRSPRLGFRTIRRL